MISHITTLANSIIGVSVLAMPFCFKQCGIILATLVLLLSSIFSRLACHFLIKSAVMSRRRNFEFLAFHAFGSLGKFLVELFIIGFLFGTCIAYFVVAGDLGPQIIGEIIDKKPENIRTSFLITTGLFIVLPLGLLRNVDSLASVSIASIGFYICLVLKIISESTNQIFVGDWQNKVNFWRPAGLLQCIPIFSLALFCQTQLFEIFHSVSNVTLEKMDQIVRGALNICTGVYISVGIFGYIAFCSEPFTGNILMSFKPSVTSEIIKIGFVLSVAFSFPLVIFPCRASLNSLLFKQGYTYETSISYISESRFRYLTTFIVTVALILGVLIPNIEFVLGIVGSTIGVIICLIFPAAFFISINTKNTNERLLAQVIVIIGVSIMVLGTYANLYAIEQSSNLKATVSIPDLPELMNNPFPGVHNPEDDKKKDIKENRLEPIINTNIQLERNNVKQDVPVQQLLVEEKIKNQKSLHSDLETKNVQEVKINNISIDNKLIKEAAIAFDSLKKIKKTNGKILEIPANQELIKKPEKVNLNQKNDIAVDAIKKEETELAADNEISNADPVERREQLDKTLKKHIMEQKEMMKEQKKLLKDIEQRVKKVESIELKSNLSQLQKSLLKKKPEGQMKEKKSIKNHNVTKEMPQSQRIEVKQGNISNKVNSAEIKADTNQNKLENPGIKRNILENHEIKKREVNNKENLLYIDNNFKKADNFMDGAVEGTLSGQESCKEKDIKLKNI